MGGEGKRPATIGNRIAPPRFLLFLFLFGLASGIGSIWLKLSHALLAGFDLAAAVFLITCIPLLARGRPEEMRRHAAENDAARLTLLVVTGLVMASLLVLIAVQFGGALSFPVKLLVLATLVLAWLFSNSVYAMHYAHLCYSADCPGDGGCGGLQFPGTETPDYWDFLYFSFTLGMASQTADVAITDRSIRRIALFHCMAAFTFNLGLISFTIGVLSGG